MFSREEISNKNDRKSQASDTPTLISPYTHSPTLQIKVGKNGKGGHHGKVTGSTDLLNSIIYQITTINDGTSKIRLCMDPQEPTQKHKR